MSSVFFAVLCWDMASDRINWKNAVWIPVAALITPIVLWMIYYLLNKYMCIECTRSSLADDHSSLLQANEIEKRTISGDVELKLSLYHSSSSSLTGVRDSGIIRDAYINSSFNDNAFPDEVTSPFSM
jgi:hypothetical protein